MHTAEYGIPTVIKKNAGPLKELIDSYELIVNNNPDYVTHLSS